MINIEIITGRIGKMLNKAKNQKNGWGAAVAAALGIGSSIAQDDRNMNNARELGRFSQNQQKAMNKFNNAEALKQNEKIPLSMREGYEKAGLNVGLMYEGGGSGGSTPQSSSAPSINYKAPDPVGMGMLVSQSAMQMAQVKNIEADTKKKEVEADKLAGVDTELGQTQILSLTQGIKNQQAVETLTKAEGMLKEMDVQIKGATATEQADIIKWTAGKVEQELRQAENQTYISNNTKQTIVAQVKTNLIGSILQNEQTVAQTGKIEMDTKATSASIVQKWDELKNQDDREGIEMAKQRMEQDLRNRGYDLETARLIINIMSMGMMGQEGGHNVYNTTQTPETPKAKANDNWEKPREGRALPKRYK